MRCFHLIGALVIALSFAAMHAHAEDTRLAGDQIIQAIADRQVNAVNPKGKKWSAVFKSDGSVTYSGGGKGTWRVDGEKFCDFPEGDKEYCGLFVSLGGNKYQLMSLDGKKKGSVLTIE